MEILIAGYPYIKEVYLKTFDFYPGGDICFLLPKVWKAKGGKLIFKLLARNNIYVTKSFFYHSNYPIIGGLLKGWLPLFPLYLFKIRRIKQVFSPTEPVLLTTLYQGLWAKTAGKKHIIFTWENVSYDQKLKGFKGLIQKLILRLNLFFCDAVICGNQKAKTIFERLTKKPLAVIPLSGIDADFFHKVNADKFLYTHGLKDKLVFSFAGAIGYRKGIHNMIHAFRKVLITLPQSHLVIAGIGEYEKEISKLIIEVGLQAHITRIPWLDPIGLRVFLSASHVFLYPSMPYGGWEEQFGYSIAEASLMELPVISTMSGSIADVVINGKTGLLVKPGAVESLAEAMLRLGSDELLRKKMGQAGREYIIRNFTYRIVAGKFYEFFKKINLHS